MKRLEWGDALIALGIIGSIIGIISGLALLANGAGLIGLIIAVLMIVAGPRLVIKGIHQKAADIKARREFTSPQLP